MSRADWRVAFENVLKRTYFNDVADDQWGEKHLSGALQDHVSRRYDQISNHYVPWVASACDLTKTEVVEIGSGTGSSTAAFAQCCQRIHGYEIDERSVVAAKARFDLMGLRNATVALTNPAKQLDVVCANHASGVSAVLLFAVLEHMTIPERLSTLKACWKILLPGGYLIVAESPNRLTYYDRHTSWLPFFQFLPPDLAIWYYNRSPRKYFTTEMEKAVRDRGVDEAKMGMARWGTGISYHEFEVALNANLSDALVSDGGESEHIRKIYPPAAVEFLLKAYFVQANVNRPLAFANEMINVVLQKR